MAKTIRLVLQCSRQIQKKHGSHETNVRQNIQLKIGPMDLLIVRQRTWQYFLISGPALDEVCEAQELATAGEVILSAAAWEQCEQQSLRTRRCEGKRARKVTDMDWMPWSESQDVLRRLVQYPMEHRLEGEGAMRPPLMPHDPDAEEEIRKYIPEAALRKLDDRVPLDFFSELRPVTSLFVQLRLAAGSSKEDFCVILRNASRMMLEILRPHNGEINKVLLFDKGCTFLCVFGLTGEKLPYESVHALQCASQISYACPMMLREIQAVSVAVTSGTVFCGVLGHPLRHEYTVIGQKVNLAARMMVNYPGLVSCDAVTYAASRLPPHYFKKLEDKEMKGLEHPGTVYEYLGITKEDIFGMALTTERSEELPLLGREKEIDLFRSCLEAYKELGQRHILAFEGRLGSGRSHLLTELAHLGQEAGYRVVAMKLVEVNMRQSFSALRTLMARALGLHDCESSSARQSVLQEKLQGTIEESSYCHLNDIFLVEFPVSDKVRKMHETERKNELHATWTKVLEKVSISPSFLLGRRRTTTLPAAGSAPQQTTCFFQTIGGEFGIVVIGNAHFIDLASWSIMSPVLRNISLFMVISLAPGYARTENFRKAAADNTTPQKITYLRLAELKPSAVVQKVCKSLGVVSISRDLARFLIQRSSGNPYYCEELLRCLRSNDMLLFRTRRQGEKAEDNWESLIIEASSLPAPSSSSAGTDGRVCIIRPDVNLENTVLPATLKEVVLAQLDRTKPLKQMILKFAAVIGPVFTTQMLSHILPADVRHKMNCLLDMLVSDNILKWLKDTELPEDAQEGPAICPQAEHGMESPCLSRKAVQQQCSVLAFRVPLLREVAYELWPARQRGTLHRKCAAFLEQHAHKCQSCGQGDFVAFHRFAVTSTQDGGSCRSPAEQGDSCSWEALVLAGEQLKRNRIRDTEGMLAAESEQAAELPSKTDGKSSSACSCECEAIVESVLVPLARHYKAMGDTARAFYYLLECAAAYLHVSNIYMALMKLNEAEVLRNSVAERAKVIARFEEATFFSLKGEACWRMGRVKLAKKMIRKALSLLKRHFPRTIVGAFVKSQVEKLPCAAYVARRASSLPQEARRKRLARLLRQSCCLSLLEHLFSLEGTPSGPTFSRLAARMKANTDRAADSYWAADSRHRSA
ncbi:adenylate cyclase type 10-like [Calonectris borealis]|uniref:adenylate cyclase type 10-like n=1 Tax=Calonectris borealis TaxID=1323832 RepID=UPI003F4B65D4